MKQISPKRNTTRRTGLSGQVTKKYLFCWDYRALYVYVQEFIDNKKLIQLLNKYMKIYFKQNKKSENG